MPDDSALNYAAADYKNDAISINYKKSQSYIIPCSSGFRDRVTAFADSQGASVADLARGVMLLVPNETVCSCACRSATTLPACAGPWRSL